LLHVAINQFLICGHGEAQPDWYAGIGAGVLASHVLDHLAGWAAPRRIRNRKIAVRTAVELPGAFDVFGRRLASYAMRAGNLSSVRAIQMQTKAQGRVEKLLIERAF
jgi:hypothetical protein